MIDVKDASRIRHMLDSAVLVGKYITDIQEEQFLKDIQLQDSVIRRLEIIAEAAAHVSEELDLLPRSKYNSIHTKIHVTQRA